MLNQTARYATFLLLAIPLQGFSWQIPDKTIYGWQWDASFRARFEDVNAPGQDNIDATTLRSVISLTSPERKSVAAFLEIENVSSLDSDSYPALPGGGGQIIADPTGTEINQFYLRWNGLPRTSIQLGRQTLAWGNHRFVGNVGFRQNNQSFDALALTAKPMDNLQIQYAYVDKVRGILGKDSPVGKQDSNTHLLRAEVSFGDQVVASVYHFDLDNRDLINNANRTSGVRLEYKNPDHAVKLGLNLEYARQQDAHDQPVAYTANYHLAELITGYSYYQLTFGQENLADDDGLAAFQTPLATLHKFQGFADLFLRTPATGIEDRYAKFQVKLGQGRFEIANHWFDSTSGSLDYGTEIDVTVSYTFTPGLNLTAKYAEFDDHEYGVGEIRKYWLQLALSL